MLSSLLALGLGKKLFVFYCGIIYQYLPITYHPAKCKDFWLVSYQGHMILDFKQCRFCRTTSTSSGQMETYSVMAAIMDPQLMYYLKR